MALKAIVLCGIGTVSECAQLDLAAWNASFRAHGARWQWSWDTFSELMRHGGARNPAERFSRIIGEPLNLDQITDSYRRLFRANLAVELPLRPGLARVLRCAALAKISLGLCSRADAAMVHALLQSTAREREGISFDALVTREDVDRLAPHPDTVSLAAKRMRVAPQECLAIADTPISAAAALDAGAHVIGFPGRLAEEQVFPSGAEVRTRLRLEDLAPLLDLEVTHEAAE